MIALAGKLWVMKCYALLWLASPSFGFDGQSYHNVCCWQSQRQTHNGEQSEPYNSKLKSTEKEQTHKAFTLCVFAPFYFPFSTAALSLSQYLCIASGRESTLSDPHSFASVGASNLAWVRIGLGLNFRIWSVNLFLILSIIQGAIIAQVPKEHTWSGEGVWVRKRLSSRR